MRLIIGVTLVIVACGALAWCVWVIWSVTRELRVAERWLTAGRRDKSAGSIPDAEIDYDYVALADLRRMSDKQLWRGYEHALGREREALEGVT